MPALPTWGGRSQFRYEGSVVTGTDIYYGKGRNGKGWKIRIGANQYSALRRHFRNRGNIPIGTSRTNPPSGSLGVWLQVNVTRTAIASYVGPILVHEGYAEREGRHDIRIIR